VTQTPAPPAIPPVPPNALEVILALALVVTVAGTVALAVGRLARRLLNVVGRESLASEPLAQRTVRLVRGMTFLVVFLILAFPALDLAGVDLGAGLHSEQLGRWAAETGIRILALVLLAFIVVRLLSAAIARAESESVTGTGLDALERRKRAQTIAGLVRRVLSGLIWGTAVLIILRELDVDITPVLTSAGIAGLAIGFGAQTLVRDVITGFFLIMEDQVRVGDAAMVNGTSGLVEQINLRTIVLRDMEGVVHVFPNGEIKTLANRTKDYSYYVIDLGVEYGADVDRIMDLMRSAGAQLQADPAFGPFILEPVEVLGVDDFKDSAVRLKIRIKTVPLKQWDVGRELRRRLKMVFDREGVRMPFPQLEVRVIRDRKAEATAKS
jgi:small-conductance mechanosensitive channel